MAARFAWIYRLDGAFVSLNFSAEEKSYLWLDSFALSETEKRKLLSKAGSAVALVKNFAQFQPLMIEFSKESVYNTMQASLLDNGGYFANELEKLRRRGITPIPYGAKNYPKAWLNLANAPLVLYAKGNLALLEERLLCIVGSRRTPPAILKLGEQMSEELSGPFVVATGVADGADCAAATGAVKNGRVICLLAGGFGSLPKGNLTLLTAVEKRGLLLSPHPYETPVFAYSYENRNRLLAALCEGTLVLSAGEKSGALITAKHANELHKRVFAIPYPPSSADGCGCNRLIKQGATLTDCAKDVLDAFGIEEFQKPKLQLTDLEQKTLELLKGGEAHISELAERLGLPVFKVTAVLAALETKNLAVKLGGNRYSAV